MNPQDFRPPESVTPLKRRAQDGIVYERTGEKRQPKYGELIWHDGLQAAPYPYDAKRDGEAVITPIWIVSQDQNWQPREVSASPENEIDRLIQEIGFGLTEEYGKYLALGSLHQAKQLERIADQLQELVMQNRGDSTPLQTQSSGSGRPCLACSNGEHSACRINESIAAPEIVCQCPVCLQAPNVQTPYGNIYHFEPHVFAGMEDNHFCTKCGAGRLHAIHQG